MTAQPKIDVKFINQILNSHGKKTTSPFHLNRLDKAISQLEKIDPIEGIAARTVYYLYLDDSLTALNFFHKFCKLYEENVTFLRLQIRIATTLGNWDLLKEAWLNYLNFLSGKDRIPYIDMFIRESNIFGDNNLPETFAVFNRNSSQTELLIKYLNDLDISIQTYRTVIETIYRITHQYFNLIGARYSSIYKGDCLQIIIESDLWENEDLQLLYQEVNRAILAIDDVDFQLEADNIEVVFINFPIENLPQDFRLDEDDDSDLIAIVSEKMQNTEEEMVKIEVANA